MPSEGDWETASVGDALRQRLPRLQPLRRIGGNALHAGGAATAGGGPGQQPSSSQGAGTNASGYSAPCIVFDVFSCATKAAFSRRAPGLPAFRVAMAQPHAAPEGGDGLPPLPAVLALVAASAPVPVQYAVVEGAEPTFFTLECGSLLNLIDL
jgi:hypothetical protein